jgi:hypothetical protein
MVVAQLIGPKIDRTRSRPPGLAVLVFPGEKQRPFQERLAGTGPPA